MRLITLSTVVMLALVGGGVTGALVFDRLEGTDRAETIAQPGSTPAPTPEATRPSPKATSPAAVAETAVFEVLGPGVMTSQSFGESSCKELWETTLANAYLPDVPQTVGTRADVTGDGIPERLKSRLTSMTGNTVVIEDRRDRFLFCDKGDLLTLSPLPNNTGFTESFFMRGDNPHSYPEGEIRVAYEWTRDHFEPAWGMVRDLPDPDSAISLEPEWECIFGQCPPEPAVPDAEMTSMESALSHEVTTSSSDEGRPPGAEGSCSSDAEAPAIQGSDVFWKRSHEALNILPPDYYTTVACWLRAIRQYTGGSGVDVVQGVFFINDDLAFAPEIEFYASSLVHDAVHVREYWQGRPYYGRDGELTALQVQMDVLRALNAPQTMIACIQEIVTNIDDAAYQYWNGAMPPCTSAAGTR